jgi:sugar phosphate permease
LVISVGAILYGIGKCIFGVVGDRYRARYIMAAGLFLSAVMNLFMGFSSSIPAFTLFWALNSCFQSMGWPPCAKLLTHWFAPTEIGTRWAMWNVSQQLGCIVTTILSPFLLIHFGWRYIFFVPGVVALGMSLFLFNRLRDTPESLKLPSVEDMTGLASAAESRKKNDEPEKKKLSYVETLKMALNNRFVWYVCFANFFTYVCKMTLFYWGPTLLLESKESSLTGASLQMVAYDIAGIFGGICAGYVSDKIFRGRRGPVSTLLTILSSIVICFLWQAPKDAGVINFICMILIGFLMAGPQILVGVAAADFASKKAAATASGFTGTFGYIGAALAGAGIGWIADNYGWNAVFLTTIISGLLSSLFFSLTWNGKSKALSKNDKKN